MKIELKYEVSIPDGPYHMRKKRLKINIEGEPDDVLAIRKIINVPLEESKWKEL